MKVAVSSSGTSLEALVDPRFGRCPYFLVVETEDMTVDAYPNENAGLQGGAGIQAARFISEKGAVAVITGRCGPNAALALSAARMRVYEAQGDIPAAKALERLKKGELTASVGDTAQTPAGDAWTTGMRPGAGRGLGQGIGRGGGRGSGRRCGGGAGRARVNMPGAPPVSRGRKQSI